MKTTKRQLEAMIRECVQKAFESFEDRESREWHSTMNGEYGSNTAGAVPTKPAPMPPPSITQGQRAAQIALRKITSKGNAGITRHASALVDQLNALKPGDEQKAMSIVKMLMSLAK